MDSAIWTLSHLVGETMSGCEHGYDHDGELTWVLTRISKIVGAALRDLEGRRGEQALELLMDLLAWDIRQGGIMTLDRIAERALDTLSEKEREAAVSRARQEMEDLPRDKWGFQTWGRRLIQWQRDELDDDNYLDLCRETGNRELLYSPTGASKSG